MSPSGTLEEIGFVLIGHILLQGQLTFVVDFDAVAEAEWWVSCVYAFRVPVKWFGLVRHNAFGVIE